MATQVPGYLKVSKVIVWIIYAWVIFGIIVLSLRIFLLAFSANPDAGFAEFIANTSAEYMQPFRGLFPAKPIGTTGYFDVSAFFAIIVYSLAGWGVSALIAYIQHKIDAFENQRRAELASRQTVPVTRKSPTNRA
jgi:uncharacterized protein YggT (Ycf19 family)